MNNPLENLKRRHARRKVAGLIFLFIALAAAASLYTFRASLRKIYEEQLQTFQPPKPEVGPTYTVSRGDLVISVRESGTIQAAKSIPISSEVEGQVRIISIVPESSQVKKGDLLVELDSSRFQDDLHQQEISLESARANLTEAEEALEIQKNQNQSDISAAELKLEFAQIELKKYVEGDWPQERRVAETDITIAEEELKRARDKFKWTEKLEGQGFVTRTELEADQLSVKKSELALERAQEKRRILEEYAYPKKLKELEAAVAEARRELSRVIQKARGQILQKEADFRAKQATFALQQQKVDKLKEQIAKCRIVAPAAGLVVYFSQASSRRFANAEGLIEEGALVRERQRIITLPDISSMRVDVEIHESEVDKIRPDQKALIAVDALPGRHFEGHVKTVGLIADSQSFWLNPELKVYNSEILIDSETRDLKPGMSAMVEIIVAELKDVLSVPVQAVTSRLGRECCFVLVGDRIEMRSVRLGLANEKFVVVQKGLDSGEKVLLYTPEASEQIAQAGFSSPPEEGVNQPVASPHDKPENTGPAPSSSASAGDATPSPPQSATPLPSPAESSGLKTTPETASMDIPREAAKPGASDGGESNWQERMRNMTPEQREEMRKRFESMSPEEREKMRSRFRGRRQSTPAEGQ